MRKSLFTAAALAVLMACAAPAQSEPSAQSAAAVPSEAIAQAEPVAAPPEPVVQVATYQAPDAVQCAVLLTRTSGALAIEAVASANYDFAGEYDLVVTKRGRSGSSDISQGGEIDAAAGEDVTLASSEFNFERGDRYSARLVLRDRDGVVCTDTRTS